MGGGWQTYRCERCPLTIELGGSVWWDEVGVVYSETVEVACGACGTMHRVTEERGECRVTALPGPIRQARTETLRDVADEEVEVAVWAAECEWRPASPYPGGIGAIGQLPCSHCGRAAGMLTLDGFRRPVGDPRPEECPVCRGPMECIAVSDAI